MSPVLQVLRQSFFKKIVTFCRSGALCGALTQTTNLTINVIKERHAVCHRCLPCHYSTTSEHKLKKIHMVHAVLMLTFFISSKSCPFLFSYMPPTWNQHRLKWLKNCQSCTVYLKMKQKLNSIFINVFLPFANSISGLSVSRFFVHSIFKTHLIFDEKSYYK